MNFIINTQIDILDVLAIIISVFALTATLRKKEFGKFYFIPKNVHRKDIWIKLIKSDLYDIHFVCEPYTNMTLRIDLYKPGAEKDEPVEFLKETKNTFEFGSLKENTIVKFRNCASTKIHIHYYDKYNNYYSQCLTQDKIDRRYHKNFWNLTFIGT